MKITRLEFHLPKGSKPHSGTCAGCGCTDWTPCEEGCALVDGSHMLCTACVARALDAIDRRRPTEVTNATDDGGQFVALIIRLKQPKPRKRR